MNQPSRKARELALRQEIIFEAAEAVLAERGFHGASVDEIARRAEVSVGTLYNLFGNKENLYATLIERQIDLVRSAVRDRVCLAATGIEKLHAAIDAIFGYFVEHEPAFRVYVRATHGLDWNVLPQFGDRIFARMQIFSGEVTALCRLAAREGSLPPIEPALLALCVLGTINSFVTRWATERKGTLAAYQQGAHAILDTLRRGRGGGSARVRGLHA